MRVEYGSKPAHTAAYCYLDAGEALYLEPGAMIAMENGFEVSAGFGGSAVKAGLRKMLGGESFFMGKYRATYDNACLIVGSRYPGDIDDVRLDGNDLLVESGCLLAAETSLEIDVRVARMTNIVMREGATMLRVHGHGTVLICSYGGLQRVTLRPGQQFAVDGGHLVALSGTCRMRPATVGHLLTTELVGEGLVYLIEGPGDVFFQTRSEQSLRDLLMPERGQNRGNH